MLFKFSEAGTSLLSLLMRARDDNIGVASLSELMTASSPISFDYYKEIFCRYSLF